MHEGTQSIVDASFFLYDTLHFARKKIPFSKFKIQLDGCVIHHMGESRCMRSTWIGNDRVFCTISSHTHHRPYVP